MRGLEDVAKLSLGFDDGARDCNPVFDAICKARVLLQEIFQLDKILTEGIQLLLGGVKLFCKRRGIDVTILDQVRDPVDVAGERRDVAIGNGGWAVGRQMADLFVDPVIAMA